MEMDQKLFNRSNNKSGFTLIELMVVLLLIGIVMAVAIPKFNSGLMQDPSKKLSRWMINATRQLRSASVQKKLTYQMVIDLDNQKIWLTREDMSEKEMAAVAEKAFSIDKSIRIINVEYPEKEPISSGLTEIRFYPAGFSDQAIIRIENNDAERRSYLVEPLLPKVKVFEQWIDY